MLHFAVLVGYLGALRRLDLGPLPVWQMTLLSLPVFGCCVALGRLSFFGIERPFLGLRVPYLGRPPLGPVEAAGPPVAWPGRSP